MKRLLRGALVASLFLLAVAVIPGASAGAAIPAPGVPTNVTVVAGGSQVTISWSAPISGATPTKYQVTGTSAGTTCAAVLTTTCVLTLPPTKPAKPAGLTVTYKVRAFNGTKAGAYSTPVSTLFGKPTIPTGVTVNPGSGVVNVRWNASSGGKYPVTGYTATATGGNTCTTTGTSCTIMGLTNGTLYNFTVTATNAVGTTVPSAPIPMNAGAPQSPTALVAAAAVNGANVSFTPRSNNGALITTYTITAHDAEVGSPSDLHQWTGLASPIHQPLLQAGHTYTFTISATNSRGQGPDSAPSNSVTLPTAPGAPTDLVATPGVSGAFVSFTAPADNGSAIIGYTAIAHDVSNPGSPSDGQGWGNNVSPIHIPLLQPGHTYNITVFASNAVGNGPVSATSSNVTLPDLAGAPTGLVATAGVNSADVTFTAPADGGSEINFYVITAHNVSLGGPGDGFQWSGGGSPLHIPSLTTGESYTFTISAANGVGQGPESAASNAVVVN